MKKAKRITSKIKIIVCIILLSFLWVQTKKKTEKPITRMAPNDWLYAQRVFPFDHINPEAYEETRLLSIELRQQHSRKKSDQENWEFAGPVNVGGRVTDVEMHSSDLQTIYTCAASGGIYKSTDQGVSWSQIFDNDYTLSIGDMAIAELDKNILYVGTGEPNIGLGSITYDGYGVFKSTDEGLSWDHVGLENAGSIGKVEIDPKNSDRVFVAAAGNVFTTNPERGIYRTIDGGKSWENVLFISDSTGGADLCIHPYNTDTVYAAMWEKVRYAHRRNYSGLSGGIFRTYDGGDSWVKLTNGLPGGDISRIGLCISQSIPEIIYAIYSIEGGYYGDVYKTVDGGNSWIATNSNLGTYNYPGYYWFSKIHIDPLDPNVVYASEFNMHKTINGGLSWSLIPGLHVDQHAIYVHPQDNNFVIIGNDGGTYISRNATLTNSFIRTLPITQFYTCETDYQHPERLFGGTQDNGTNGTLTGNLDDWERIYGGDGFIVRVDPVDNNYIYASSQRGGFGRSIDGGISWDNTKPGITDTRFNWKTPYILDPNDPSVLYIGGHRVYKSTNRAVSWDVISNDLTNGAQDWGYGTLTSLAVSAINPEIIYAGTDDGNVWVTSNGGGLNNWTKISDDLPLRWVTCVAADPFEENTAYVTFSGIRNKDYIPRVFKTNDLGESWIDISSNLPDFPINNIIIDPENAGFYYVATDGGVFVSHDSGTNWTLLGTGLPNSPVLDLNLHNPTRTLLAATYGRSMWRISVEPALKIKDIEAHQKTFKIYPNPSSDIVNISFNMNSTQKGKLIIYDISGKIIEVIHDGLFYEGNQNFVWGRRYSVNNRKAGSYICRLITEKSIFSGRIQILDN